MSTVFEIPLSPTAQKFNIDLLDVNYELRVVWNPASACWVLDIADTNSVPIACGIALVTGADLMGQLAYLGLGGGLLVATDASLQAVPTYDNIGSSSHLFFVPEA